MDACRNSRRSAGTTPGAPRSEPYAEQGLVPGRVAVQHRGEYDVVTATGEQRSRITSRLRRESDRTALPVVGDWVALDPSGAIVDVVPRRTTISRRAAHEPASGVSREQVIAANVDVVFVVQALGQELDRRLLERYLALAVESGARPVVLLTKADLEDDPAAVAAELSGVGGEVPIHVVSARAGLGLETVRALLHSWRDGRAPRARPASGSRPSSTRWSATTRALRPARSPRTARDAIRPRAASSSCSPAAASSSTTRACERFISGSARAACRTPSTTSPSSPPRAGSPTAGTRPSRAAPSSRRSSPASCRASAGRATARSSARWRSSRTASSSASAPAPGAGRVRERS